MAATTTAPDATTGDDDRTSDSTNGNNAGNESKNLTNAGQNTGGDDNMKPLHPNDGGDGTHTPPRTHIDEELLKPLWIAKIIVNYPCKMCWCIIILMFILAAIDSTLFELSETSDRTWFVQDDPTVIDYDTWTLAEESFSNHGGDDFFTDPQTEEAPFLTVYWMFELDSYNGDLDKNNPSKTDYWILTPENIEIIIKYEDMVLNDTEFTDYYCYVTNTTTYDCQYTSLARQVAENWDYDYQSMTSEEIKEYILDLYWYTSDTPGTIESSFNKGFEDTNQTYLYRSFLLSGLPVAEKVKYHYDSDGNVLRINKTSSYINDNDRLSDQVDIFNEWAVDLWEDITVDNNAEYTEGDLRIVYFVTTVYQDYFNLLLLASMGWVGAAIMCVLFWVTFHLQSIILSVLALFQIILSFPFAYFIYRIIGGISHFDTLSLLIIFVLLGVGADDVFVFTDAWRQSVHFVRNPDSILERMTFTYRRAVRAMAVTQTTTFMAFFATSLSSIMPISAFGIWAALIVLCNYLLVITLYPVLALIHFKYIQPFEQKYCCCFRTFAYACKFNNNKEDKDEENEKKDSNNEIKSPDFAIGTEIELGNKNSKNEEDERDDEIPPNLERNKSVEEQSVNYGCLERFFALTWANWINIARIPVLISFVALFVVVIWRASMLEEQDEDEAFFATNHYMQKTQDMSSEFSAAQESGLVYVVQMWGPKGVNRGDSDYWDPTDYGKIKWDSDFDISSNESQQYLYDSCVELQESDLAFQASSVFCPMSYFKDYLEDNDEEFPYIYTNTYGNDTDTDAADVEYNETIQKEMFIQKLINFTESSHALILNSNGLLFVDDTDKDNPLLRYVGIGAYTSDAWDASLSVGRKFQDDWYDWMDKTYKNNNNCPSSLKKHVRAVSRRWCWMITNREFILSAFQGIGIALPLAFVVLLISTQNWIMSIFATLDIIGVMACELGVMEMMGWQFGVSESVAIVIVIGFSVDYVVHLANAYLECPSGVRSERISFSLLTMGISVVSGAITTLLAGICLTFPSITFFFKMGILIITTICFSLAWSMLFFIALLAQFGPQFENGHIPFHKIKYFICRRDIESQDE